IVHEATRPPASPATRPFQTLPSPSRIAPNPFHLALSRRTFGCEFAAEFAATARHAANAAKPSPASNEPAINGCTEAFVYTLDSETYQYNHHVLHHRLKVRANYQDHPRVSADLISAS